MAIVDELISVLGYDLQGTENLRRFESGMERAKQRAVAFGAALAKAFAAAGAALAAGSVFLAKGAIETGAEFEKLETILTTIEGSSDKAKSALDWVQEFAKTTPYDLQQVAESFVRLRAYGLDPMGGQLEAIGNAASAMGKSLMQGVEAVADAAQGENERLKEFGIRAKVEGDKVTYSWQQNGQEMSRTINKTGAEIIKTLTEIFNERFPGAMEAQSRMWSGMVSNMGDTWTAFQKKIADAGFFDWMKENLRSLLDWVNALEADGTLDRWAKTFSDGFIAAGRSVARMVRFVTSSLRRLGDFLSSLSFGTLDVSALQTFALLMGALLRFVAPTVFWLTAAYLVLDDFLTYMEGGKSVIGDFITKIQELTGSSEGVAQGLAGLGAAISVGLIALAPRILAGLVSAFALVSNPAGWAIILGGVAAGLVYYFRDELAAAFPSLTATVRSQFASLGSILETVSKPIRDFFDGFAERIATVDFSAGFESLTDTLSRLWDSVTKLGQAFLDLGAAISRLFDTGTDGKAVMATIGQLSKLLGNLAGSTIIAALEGLQGILNAVSSGIDAVGNAIDRLSQGDFLGAWNAIGEGIINIASDIADAVEDMIQAFVPNFSFAALWEPIQSAMDRFVAWLKGWVERLNALFALINWPQPPQWWTDIVSANDERQRGAQAGAVVGAMANEPARQRSAQVDTPAVSTPTTTERTERRERAAAGNSGSEIADMLRNFQIYAQRSSPERVVEQVTNDNRQDNRQFPVSASVTVNQTVTQAVQAPLGAANATGAAVGRVVTSQASRIEQEPAR